MCKTNVKTNIYLTNICKHEHEKNMTNLWCKIVLKLVLNILKEMRGPTSTYTFLGPSSRKLPRRLLCVHKINKLLENLS
jgi:hypothetical protein